MKELLSIFSLFAGKILCSLLGHSFQVTRKITAHIKEYQCCCCGEEITDTADGLQAKLTPRFKETNSFVAQIYKRRSEVIFS